MPVHTSQNKELMQFTERTDVVDLAKWLQNMIENTYRENENESFTNMFYNM